MLKKWEIGLYILLALICLAETICEALLWLRS